MSTPHRHFTANRILIILTLLAAGIFTYLRSHYRELIMDEIVYQYVLDTDHYGGYWENNGLHTRIQTIGDVINSQMNHYVYGNGRFIVHFIEQVFSGVLPMELYYVIGGLLMIVLIWSIVHLGVPTPQRGNPWWWMGTVIAVIYLFPYIHRLWYSINISCNYLIPAVLMTITLILFQRLNSGQLNGWQKVLTALVALMFGASHEGYSIPIGGGFFYYYISHLKELRRNGWIIVVPMYIGILSMVLAPGNLSRYLSYDNGGNVSFLSDILICIKVHLIRISEIPMIWVSLVIVLYLKYRYRLSFRLIYDNDMLFRVLFISLLCGLLFYIVVHPVGHAYTSITLIALIITLKFLSSVIQLSSFTKRKGLVAYVCVLFVFIISQSFITRDSRTMSIFQHKMIEEYLASEDGVVLNNPPGLPFYTRPFITFWPAGVQQDPLIDIILSGAYSGYKKPFYMLDIDEFNAVKGRGVKMPGGTTFIKGGVYFWAELNSLDSTTQGYEMEYLPVDFNHTTAPLFLRLKFALMPEHYPSHAMADTDTITIGSRTFLRIQVPEIRKVKSIRALKN